MELPLTFDCYNTYIVNGCFECYDYLWCVEGREAGTGSGENYGGFMRKEAQFENALGGVDRTQLKYESPKVPIGDDKIQLNGWYSPTNYSPNYFNYDNSALGGNYKRYFRLGTNWLNLRDENSVDTTKQRYPQGWVLDDDEPTPSNSQNYGYVGFWTHTLKSSGTGKLEYIQQRLKQPLLYNSEDDPIIYNISFDMSKNFSLANFPEVVSGSQRIGAFFSKTAPTHYGFPQNDMVFSSNSVANGTLVLVDDDELDIGKDGGEKGVDNWVHFEKDFHVKELANYITIGLFSVIENGVETNFKEHSSQFETAYYIDNVVIQKVSYENTLCDCNKPGTDIRAAEIEIVPVSKDLSGCCFNYFFNYLANINCIVTSISALISINGVEKSTQTYNYQTSWANKQFYFGGDICFTAAELAPTEDHPIPEVTFSFSYILNGTTPCTIVKTLNLNCETSCICDNTAPVPVQLIKNDKEACCYDIILKLNEDNSIEKYCKYNEMEVIDITNINEEKFLFGETANKENGISKDDMWYYNPTKTITFSNDELCFDPMNIPNSPSRVIKIRLRNMVTGEWCEFEQTIFLNCPINCSDLARLPDTQPPPLELIFTPTGTNPDGDCCYQVSLINNTGFNINIPEIELNFTSSGSRVSNFQYYHITDNNPLLWEHWYSNGSQAIGIQALPNGTIGIINPLSTIHLINICIPKSNSTVDVECMILDKYGKDINFCSISKQKLSCPVDVCECDYSLLDFKLSAIVNEDADEECCYNVTITPPNTYLDCNFNSAKVFVKQPGEEEFELTTLVHEFSGAFNSNYTFTNTFCIDPDGDNSAFSVKVEFENTTTHKTCEVVKDFEFADCPCSCDENGSGLNFEFEVNPPGSCCYDIYLSSDCTRFFTEFNIEFPNVFSGALDKILFSPKTNDITYEQVPNSNIFTYKPIIPVSIFRDTRIYIGSFCLPPALASSLPQSISVTAKDLNGGACKVQSLNMTCSCCDGATVTVVSLGNCVWDIIINNTSDCWLTNYGADHYSYINDITKGTMFGQPSPMPVPSPWTKTVSLSKGDYRTLEIVWAINNLPICSKIITLECSYIGDPADDEGGYHHEAQNGKIVIPFTNVNMGVIENFGFTPNPASTEATISYDLLNDVKTLSLAIYNIKGDIVSNIPVSNYSKGQNNINLNTTNINSGSYYLVLIADKAKMCLPIRIVR
ncbi:MAG: T9SS type A sorting domain-containing protein [bacterium]